MRYGARNLVSLVTSGCGFIRSHLVERLLAEGHIVKVIDNRTTGRLENLDHQKANNINDIHRSL